MGNYRDIGKAHDQFKERLKRKHERAEKLRNLFEKGKKLFSRDGKGFDKKPDTKPSHYVKQQRTKYSASYPVTPSPTPSTPYVEQKRKDSQDHQWINHRSFERSLIEQRR